MQSLQEYIISAKNNIATSQLVILGNEAADLDSMASSIAYGYLCQQITPERTILPVMPIPRADFVLRTEAVYVFNEAGINIDDVVFMDEVNLDTVLESANIVLVDHNKIAVNLEKYGHKITGVVDHHKDEGLYLDAIPRIITTIGSTTSLVAQEFAKASIIISENLAILLGGTILLDTVNLAE
jgi:exopolyphosphatase